MSNIKNTIEQLQYSIDVFKEYIYDLQQNDDVNKMFALGKIAAAFEEVKIQYNCLYDDIFDEDNEPISKNGDNNYNFADTISSIGAADYWSKNSTFFNMNNDYLKINSELTEKDH